MAGHEAILPTELSLDYTIEVLFEDIVKENDQRNEEYDDIIDIFNLPIADPIVVNECVEAIARPLANTEQDLNELTTAGARAMLFVAQTLRQTITVDYDLNISGYLYNMFGDGDFIDHIRQDTQDYLQTRPHIDALLGYFMHEIDPSGHRADFAESMGALLFLLAERNLGEQYWTSEIDSLS